MTEHIFAILREYLAAYGYWAVAGTLLLENAGVPVPGETILLLASFLAYSEHRLRLPYIVLTAVCAATFGDNLGFLIGHFGGRPLLMRYRQALHIKPEVIERGEQVFARYGPPTIFVARFIAGLRVVAGPLAGVLRMHWRDFVIFNFLGAVVWVAAISSVGYFFGQHWDQVVSMVKDANILILVVVGVGAGIWFWRKRKKAA